VRPLGVRYQSLPLRAPAQVAELLVGHRAPLTKWLGIPGCSASKSSHQRASRQFALSCACLPYLTTESSSTLPPPQQPTQSPHLLRTSRSDAASSLIDAVLALPIPLPPIRADCQLSCCTALRCPDHWLSLSLPARPVQRGGRQTPSERKQAPLPHPLVAIGLVTVFSPRKPITLRLWLHAHSLTSRSESSARPPSTSYPSSGFLGPISGPVASRSERIVLASHRIASHRSARPSAPENRTLCEAAISRSAGCILRICRHNLF